MGHRQRLECPVLATETRDVAHALADHFACNAMLSYNVRTYTYTVNTPRSRLLLPDLWQMAWEESLQEWGLLEYLSIYGVLGNHGKFRLPPTVGVQFAGTANGGEVARLGGGPTQGRLVFNRTLA